MGGEAVAADAPSRAVRCDRPSEVPADPEPPTARDTSSGSSLAINPIGCGSPTSPNTAHGKARCTAPRSSTRTPGASWGGRSTPVTTRLSWRTPSTWPSAVDPDRRDGDPLRPRDAVHLVGLHSARARAGLLPSIGTVGDGYDNAMMERFWAWMQIELLEPQTLEDRVELANAIFSYIEIFHNRHRRHSALGMPTPIEFEARHQQPTSAAGVQSADCHRTQGTPGLHQPRAIQVAHGARLAKA